MKFQVKFTILLMASYLLFGSCGLLFARPDKKSPEKPPTVNVGIYVDDVYEIDLKTMSFSADFYAWQRWRGKTNGDFAPSGFSAVNGTLTQVEAPDAWDDKKSDLHWRNYHYVGKFRVPMDFHNYPLDSQNLVIAINDPNADSLSIRYSLDTNGVKNWITTHPIGLGSWAIKNSATNTITPRISFTRYASDFGYPKEAWEGDPVYRLYSNQGAVYDTLQFDLPIQRRDGLAVYVKTFLALFISMAIAMLAFFISPHDIDPRFGVGVAAVFGAVSSMIVVSNNTQETPYMTIADKIHFFTLFMIFLTILLSCVSLRLQRTGKIGARSALDLFAGSGCLIFFIGGVALLSMTGH
jgi:hypothetical protein